MIEYDQQALEEALTILSDAALAARDSLIMGDDKELRVAFDKALSALCKCVSQISLRNKLK